MAKYRCAYVDCGGVLDLTKVALGEMEDWVYNPRTLHAWCPDHIPRIYDTKYTTAEAWGAAGYRITGGREDEAWLLES